MLFYYYFLKCGCYSLSSIFKPQLFINLMIYMCAQSLIHVWLCDLMNYSLPGSSLHGNFQARILKWVASSRGWTQVHCIPGMQLNLYQLNHNTRKDYTHTHHQMVNTKIRLIIFFAAEDGEALNSQQKQDQEMTAAQITNSLLPNSDFNWRK